MSDDRVMTCAEIRERLPLVPGADLLPAEDRIVRAHLAACHACRTELGSFVRARGALRRLGEASAAAGGADADTFFADLRRDTLAAVAEKSAPRQRARASVGGLMTAAALLLLGVYLFSMWPRDRSVELPGAPFPVYEVPGMRSVRFGENYGLSGHREQFPTLLVPMDRSEALAPERDANAAVLREIEYLRRRLKRDAAGLSTRR